MQRVFAWPTAALEAAITPNTVAFLVEPIQGEAGVIIPPTGYFKLVRESELALVSAVWFSFSSARRMVATLSADAAARSSAVQRMRERAALI